MHRHLFLNTLVKLFHPVPPPFQTHPPVYEPSCPCVRRTTDEPSYLFLRRWGMTVCHTVMCDVHITRFHRNCIVCV